ncbi:MAG: Rv3235 family protein [Ornithinimicrobium sp.]
MPIPQVDPEPLTAAAYRALTAEPVRKSGYRQIAFAMPLRGSEKEASFEAQPTSASDLPDPTAWAGQALRVVLEVMDGSRPARQLSRWVTRGIQDRAARRGLLARQRGGRGHRVNLVRSVHVCTPRDGVAEVAALVVHNGRHRAVALRLEGVDGRWLISALEMG